MRTIQRVLATLAIICYGGMTVAQTLPTTDLLTGPNGINYTTANTWENYTFNFTPTTSGSNYVGFAFRQDPAYWTLGNVSLTTGASNNLLLNGNFATGGAIPGQNGLQAPQYWGVWYQNGVTPAAAGNWQAPGTNWQNITYTGGQGVNTSTAGSWIDGAVGSFDGIYQGISLTAGTTYALSFTAYGNNPAGPGIQLGVYAGACADTTLAAGSCTMRSGTGFTAIATPDQGASAGQTGPTVVSTAAGADIVSTSTTTGTPVTTSATTYGASSAVSTDSRGTTTVVQNTSYARGVATVAVLGITQTIVTTSSTPVITTTVTTTPYTTVTTTTTPTTVTTTTTPTTVTTYSDNTTTTTQGTPVTTTTAGAPIVTTNTVTGDQIVTTTNNWMDTQVSQAQNNYTTRVDQHTQLNSVNQNMNQSLESDPFTRVRIENTRLKQRSFSGRDYNLYITGSGFRTSTKDTYSGTGTAYGIGIEKLFAPRLLAGVAFNRGNYNMNGNNASGSLAKDAVNAYALVVLPRDFLIKADVGYAQNNYTTGHSIPELALANSSSSRGQDLWAQTKLYSPAVMGIRVFGGARTENNRINAVSESGSAITAMNYAAVNHTSTAGIGGVRIDHNFSKKFAVHGEFGYMTNQTQTTTLNLTYHDSKNSSVLLKVGNQNYQGQSSNMVALQGRVNF